MDYASDANRLLTKMGDDYYFSKGWGGEGGLINGGRSSIKSFTKIQITRVSSHTLNLVFFICILTLIYPSPICPLPERHQI